MASYLIKDTTKEERAQIVADEVLAILSDRNRIMDKKKTEAANARWNEMTWNGFPFGEEDE